MALKRQTLSEQIKDHLAQQIASGALAPGDRLVELSIARDMGTSQAPVREALRDLEAHGAKTGHRDTQCGRLSPGHR